MCNPNVNYWPGKQTRAGENIELTAADGAGFQVHVSRPEGSPPYPTVLIVQDYFDPESYYYDLADQYAGAGYLAACPDLFARQGKLPEQTHEAAGARIGAVADDVAIGDLETTLEHLKGEGLVGNLAVTGFCWGGRVAYLFAARHPEVKLLIPFYGHLTAWTGPDGAKPYSPLEEASKIQARVVGSYGGGDESIPLTDVSQMEERLQAAGRVAELKVYDGAPHCFFRTPEWEAASNDSWDRVMSALKETVA
ncbi:MAG TPA: dienelactone hydrolase family protein [Candidatus Solibacter sp.]|jgi:carboxymethylenebutenolidase|nr:dienelactone hydrolase family protein [Candidatus Solibacter sp.]